mmetsp:Transcript_9820/g.13542  ORF Transcript_9820/g.13542 Transcript_9820/m.13542 type:complete len:343 (-) Transcript_9820:110-1138(-)
MKAYRKIENKKPEGSIKEDEIRIMAGPRGNNRRYVNYALKKLGHLPQELKKDAEGEADAEGKQPEETPLRAVTFRAMGQAINTTVEVVESVKRTIPGLHQLNEISSSEITDVYEPLYEGLRTVKVTRRVARIEITLSKDQPADTSHVGYQPPKTEEEILAEEKKAKAAAKGKKKARGGKGGRGRKRNSRRGKQQNDAAEQNDAADEASPEGPVEGAEDGKQRGRGRRGRGRGRGRQGRGRRKRSRGRGKRKEKDAEAAAEEGKQQPGKGEEGKPEGKTETPAEGEKGGRGRGGGGRRGKGRGRRRGRRGRGRGRGGRGRGGRNGAAPPRFSEDNGGEVQNAD